MQAYVCTYGLATGGPPPGGTHNGESCSPALGTAPAAVGNLSPFMGLHEHAVSGRPPRARSTHITPSTTKTTGIYPTQLHKKNTVQANRSVGCTQIPTYVLPLNDDVPCRDPTQPHGENNHRPQSPQATKRGEPNNKQNNHGKRRKREQRLGLGITVRAPLKCARQCSSGHFEQGNRGQRLKREGAGADRGKDRTSQSCRQPRRCRRHGPPPPYGGRGVGWDATVGGIYATDCGGGTAAQGARHGGGRAQIGERNSGRISPEANRPVRGIPSVVLFPVQGCSHHCARWVVAAPPAAAAADNRAHRRQSLPTKTNTITPSRPLTSSPSLPPESEDGEGGRQTTAAGLGKSHRGANLPFGAP